MNFKDRNIYFTVISPSNGGLTDSVWAFLQIFHTIKDLVGLPFVYTPFKYGHLHPEDHGTLDKYVGFAFKYKNINELSDFNYKHSHVDLGALLKEASGELEYIKKFFQRDDDVIYHIYTTQVVTALANDLLLKHNLKRLQERKLTCFRHPEAVNYRSSLKQKSLFGAGGVKLFFNYRMGDFSILKIDSDLYYDYSRDSFYASQQAALEDRKWPFRDPMTLLPVIKKYLNAYPGAQSILVTDGYTYKHRPRLDPYLKGIDSSAFLKKESKKFLNEILPFFTLEPFIGDPQMSINSLFITLQTMMDSDEAIGCPGQASTFTKLHSYCL